MHQIIIFSFFFVNYWPENHDIYDFGAKNLLTIQIMNKHNN